MKPYYEHAGITIYYGDCREILPQIGSVDLVLTDPPYGTGWVRGGGDVGEFNAKFTREAWDVWSTDWIGSRRTAFFGPNSRLEEMKQICQSILWWKKTNPRPKGPDREPIGLTHDRMVGTYECYNGDTPNHPCEKPLDLLLWLVQNLSPAESILDPFMGSGTTLRAAKDLGRRAIGIEIEEKYCEIAAKRLSQEVFSW
jgi:site-specific DNA-methyltransferase (adenine-specific)